MNHSEVAASKFFRKHDSRGKISVIDFLADIPFMVKRIFFLSDVPQNESRGGHGHFTCEQFIFCVTGSIRIEITNDRGASVIFLDSESGGVYVPPLNYLDLRNFSVGTVVGVLASEEFREEDYYYDKPLGLEK